MREQKLAELKAAAYGLSAAVGWQEASKLIKQVADEVSNDGYRNWSGNR